MDLDLCPENDPDDLEEDEDWEEEDEEETEEDEAGEEGDVEEDDKEDEDEWEVNGCGVVVLPTRTAVGSPNRASNAVPTRMVRKPTSRAVARLVDSGSSSPSVAIPPTIVTTLFVTAFMAETMSARPC